MTDETAQETTEAATEGQDSTVLTGDGTTDESTTTDQAETSRSQETNTGEGEGKDDKKDEGKASDKETGKESDAEGEPEAFDASKLELPEGFELDEDLATGLKEVIEDAEMTPQQRGQKLAEMHAQAIQGMQERQKEAFNTLTQQWVEQARADKEIGGEKFDENVATAQKAIAKFGSPELKEALQQSGLGNHPELIRFCARIGKTISEDSFTAPDAATSQRKSPDEVLYDNT